MMDVGDAAAPRGNPFDHTLTCRDYILLTRTQVKWNSHLLGNRKIVDTDRAIPEQEIVHETNLGYHARRS